MAASVPASVAIDQAAEIARLKAELAKHEHCIDEIQADQLAMAEQENELYEEKDAEIERLRTFIDQWARHQVSCAHSHMHHGAEVPSCDCGYAEALAALAQARR